MATTTSTPTLSNRNISFEQIQRNFIVNPISEENQRLYFGDANSVNYYAILTNFYVNALWGQYPQTAAPNELLAALECSTIQRSINGWGAVVKFGEAYEAVNTRYYWRAIDLETGRQAGHVLMFPYNDESDQTRGHVPNKIRVISYRFGDGAVRVQNFDFSGSTLGNSVGDSMTGDSSIVVWGDGVNDYDNVKWLVNELNKRLTKNSSLLDRHSSPHIQGPPIAVNTDSGRSQVNIDQEGSFLPVDNPNNEYKYLTWDSQGSLSTFTIDKVIDLLHLQTGIPMSAFGMVRNTASGVSLERQMFAALAKVRRWRRSIEMSVAEMDITDFQWPNDPFAGWRETLEGEQILVQSGIISPEQSMARLGIS